MPEPLVDLVPEVVEEGGADWSVAAFYRQYIVCDDPMFDQVGEAVGAVVREEVVELEKGVYGALEVMWRGQRRPVLEVEGVDDPSTFLDGGKLLKCLLVMVRLLLAVGRSGGKCGANLCLGFIVDLPVREDFRRRDGSQP